jgi:IPT/TIG domain-containing protein
VARQQRALDAMALAARRARAPTQEASATRDPPWGEFVDDGVAPAGREVELVHDDVPRSLKALVLASAFVLVGLLGTLAGVEAQGQPGSSRFAAAPHGPASRRSSESVGASPSGTVLPATMPSAPILQPPATAPSSSVTTPPAGVPILGSLTPGQGVAGQAVSISGSNLYSADAQVVVSFGTQTAPTTCPSQSTCVATVPPQKAGTQDVPVTITTSQGTSNPLPFQYQSGAISTVGEGQASVWDWHPTHFPGHRRSTDWGD